ncbi:MAG: RNA polymerase sigma factor [Rhodospirillaceae bacterium]
MSRILRSFIENEAALRRFLSRFLSRRHQIEDIAQETFLQAFAAESKSDIRAPKAYLFRVAKNLALNSLARKSFSDTDYIEDFADSEVLTDDGQISVEDEVSARQQLVIVSQAIMTLPKQCRRAFVMRKMEGLSYKEIAHRLSLSESTVEKQVATGLSKCIDVLRRQGHDPTDFGAKARKQGSNVQQMKPLAKTNGHKT